MIGTSDGYQYDDSIQHALGNGVPITPSAAVEDAARKQKTNQELDKLWFEQAIPPVDTPPPPLENSPVVAPQSPAGALKKDQATTLAGSFSEKQNQ